MNLLLKQHPRPINTTIACPDVSVDELRTVITSRTVVRSNSARISEYFKVLEEETQLLKTVLYKNHNRFRNDKGYKTLRMLEKSTVRCLQSDCLTVLTGLLELLPSSPHVSDLRLPTLPMLHHAQLRLYQLTAGVSRVESLARRCGLLSVQRLNLGHFWGTAAVNLGLVSRVWVVSRSVLAHLHSAYSHLGIISSPLPGDSPTQYQLPADLSEFCQHIDTDLMMKNNKPVMIEEAAFVSVDDFLDICEPVRRTDAKRDANVVENPVKKNKESENTDNNSMIKASKTKIETEQVNEAEASKDVLSDIHSIEELKNFLNQESKSRKIARKTSFTRVLSQEEWKSLKNDVLSSIKPSKPNKSLKICRKIIRSVIGNK